MSQRLPTQAWSVKYILALFLEPKGEGRLPLKAHGHYQEAGCFVVNATAWRDADQQAKIMEDTGCNIGPISSGCFTAIVSPEGELMGEPLRSGEGAVIADLDFLLIEKRKRIIDSRGHYSRPELLSLLTDRTPVAHVHERSAHSMSTVETIGDDCAVLGGESR